MAGATVKEPRATPRISVNKLAEYLTASLSRRRKIVFDSKYPSDYIVIRYKAARAAIKDFFQTGDVQVLHNAIAELEAKATNNDFQKNDKENSIAALRLFLEADVSGFTEYKISTDKDPDGIININGVDISVQPDIVLGTKIKGIKNLGGIKLNLIKSGLPANQQETVALLVKAYLNKDLGEDFVVNPKMCFSFDAFSKRFIECPKSELRKMNEVGIACEEIALWWNKV